MDTGGFSARVRREIERVVNSRAERVMYFEVQPQDPSGKGPYTPIQVKVRVTDHRIIVEGSVRGSDRWFATGNTHETVESAVAQFATLAVEAGFIREAQLKAGEKA